MTGQYTLYSWSVGHRVHHKYSDTDADPHNTRRGFFFAHMGWLFRKEHPDVSLKERLYDYSDLERDPVVMFQHKYYYFLYLMMSVIVPIGVQMLIAGDTIVNAFLLSVVMRNLSVYHDTMFVNSAAHMFGDRPYNENIPASENYFVSLASFGEGYHNYHHSFPWDYKAGEYSAGFNLTTLFLDAMFVCGQAFNMRVASEEVVSSSKNKTAARIAVRKPLLVPNVEGVPEGPSVEVQAVVEEPQLLLSTVTSWAREVIKNRRLADEDSASCEFL